MKRRRFKWFWLFLGVILISATCGFGYEAKQTRTQFEEAKDAFRQRDWKRVVANLSETNNTYAPAKEAYVQFLNAYVEPELLTEKYALKVEEVKSSMVPINNEIVSYAPKDQKGRSLIELIYFDRAIWFNIPFSKKRFGVFKRKEVSISFNSTFYRICRKRYPHLRGPDSYRSVLMFVNSEKSKLDAMGITPKNLYSEKHTWDEYIIEYEAKTKQWLQQKKG